jgi:shikimate kinase
MVILLIGLLGSGRAQIGKLLAEQLGLRYIKFDELALKQTCYKSVEEAQKVNVTEWRDIEMELAKKLSKQDDMVIVANGSFTDNALNIQYFKINSPRLCIIYLKSSSEQMMQRISKMYTTFQKKVPHQVLERMQIHLQSKHKHYSRHAHLTVDVDSKTPQEVCKNIVAILMPPSLRA